MTVLFCSKEDTRRIAVVREYARNHRITLPMVKKMMIGGLPPIGDTPAYVCDLSCGLRCVYSLEHQKDGQWYRHLSISISSGALKGGTPTPEIAELVAANFDVSIHECASIWMENGTNPNMPTAVNLLAREDPSAQSDA